MKNKKYQIDLSKNDVDFLVESKLNFDFELKESLILDENQIVVEIRFVFLLYLNGTCQ